MGWIALGVGIFFLCLLFLSRKESCGQAGGVRKLFSRMGLYLYKQICIHHLPIAGNGSVERDLERLCPGMGKNSACTEYYTKKLEKVLFVFLFGTLLGLAASVKAKESVVVDPTGTVARGSYREEPQQIELSGRIGEDIHKFRVQIAGRSLTLQEAEELFQSMWECMPEYILGDNSSLEEVTGDLSLREAYGDYPFLVEWSSSAPEIISDSGAVCGTQESREVCLTAVCAYEEWEWKRDIFIRVVPPKENPEEHTHAEIQRMLEASEQHSRREGQWKLPASWQGEPITWEQVTGDYGIWVWGGGIAAAVLIFFLSDRDLHDRLEQRRRSMKKEYPEIVHKFVLYLGAGMTVRGTVQKIAGDYERKRQAGEQENPIYGELLYACRELQAGMSEGAVYEHLGRRTGLQEYIRLSTLLMQNIKKGNAMILDRLREEADRAYLERMQDGRRLAEEAVTKLLIPMVLLLLVVMIMIMLPAFSSMGV